MPQNQESTRALALSDSQLEQIFRCAAPLQPHQRTAFLEHLGAKLQGKREVGDGELWRLIGEAQRQFFDPPSFGSGPVGKYA
jgi:hypothetical protein